MYRTIKLASRSTRSQPEALAVFVFEQPRTLPSDYQALDEQLGGVLSAALERREFSAEAGSVTTLYPTPERGRAQRLFVCGLGDPERFDGNVLRVAAAKLAGAAFAAGVTRLEAVALSAVGDRLSAEQAGTALADGLAIAGFEFSEFKGEASKTPDKREESAKPIDLSVQVESELRQAFELALTVGQGVSTARRLAATPPNVANPPYVISECRKLARRTGLRCSVIDKEKAKELGLGGLLAVGSGGSEDPALICLEWPGKQGAKGGQKKGSKKKGKASGTGQQPVLLVGKAVTFDTGGYSLKPSASMVGMKYDKCGGMTVIGIMEAVAQLELDVPVVGLVPVAENLIDDDAYRVDDILTMANGVTVEVTNTDAEGRLILADALAYGTKTYDPQAVFDLATLTGGVVVALGSYCAGAWCNDDELRRRLDAASAETGERLWPLPLWDEHRAQMKGTHADLLNASLEREASPIQGAAFLSYFVGEEGPTKLPTLPWVHLDIAGVAVMKKDTALYPKGPTGWGVRMLTRMLADWPK